MPIRIANRTARHLWLAANGLSTAPTGRLDLAALVTSLGMVQLDTIRNVARAHDHILWSRNQNYREPMLEKCLAKDRAVFEHFTHDASLLPMGFYPYWTRQFRRMRDKIDRSSWYGTMCDADERVAIKARIADEGPLCTDAFDTKVAGEKVMWSRPPHKLALDYMWYGGELATSHRQNFRKFYDLHDRVIPDEVRAREVSDQAQINWLCDTALDRLCFGSQGDIRRFYEATDVGEVKDWAERSASDLVPVEIETAGGDSLDALAPGDIETRLANLVPPTTRLRLLNPFDPAIRDRNRLMRLFGFDYQIEIFVPAAKRKWGYYVYPLLEGDRFVGRIELKADRKTGRLKVVNFWQEPKVKWGAARFEKLEAELARMARFVGLEEVVWPEELPGR